MSHSPAQAEDLDSSEVFHAAQRKLTRLIKDGMSWSGNERNCVYMNTGAGRRFANVSGVSGFDFPDDGRGIALSDWDQDGDIDVWLTSRTGPQIRFMRNENSNGNDFLMLRLQGGGKLTNRDAIGARVQVQLRGDAKPLIATLRAGESFLSQNSKWLHFGLGSKKEVQSVTVNWPGGKSEQFLGLSANGRYVLVQGSRRPQPAPARDGNLVLAPNKSESNSVPAASRIWMSKRVYWPHTYANDTDGNAVTIGGPMGKPTLVNIWASWCLPCLKEFSEWKKDESQIASAGVQIYALSVDGFTGQKPADPMQIIRKIKKKYDLSFSMGALSEESYGSIEAFHKTLFEQHRRMPVPMSFLLDADGRLAVIYRGTVAVNQLLADVKQLNSKSDPISLALPFEGSSYGRPSRLSSAFVATEMMHQGRSSDAVKYLSSNLKSFVRDYKQGTEPRAMDAYRRVAKDAAESRRYTEAKSLYESTFQFLPNHAETHFDLGMLYFVSNKYNDAAAKFVDALHADPKHIKAKLNLAISLASLGRVPQAITLYREVLKDQPNHLNAINNLGNALVSVRRPDEGVAMLREAVKLAPKDARSHYNLGAAYDATGAFEKAISHYRKAITLDPRHVLAHNNIGIDFARLGQFEESVKYLTQCIKLDDNYDAAKRNLQRVRDIMDAQRKRKGN